MPSICEISSDNCAAVYQCWKSARDTLSQSIGIYLKACDALAYLSIESLTQTIINSGCSLPDALSAIDADLSGLVDDEERLRTARLALLASRNSSKSFSRISSLPCEILSSIFLAANPDRTKHWTQRGTVYPTALSGVCQFWRHVTLELPSLWSQVHFSVDGPQLYSSYRCAELWGERSKNVGLSVDISERHFSRTPETVFHDFKSHLTSVISRVHHLEIDSSQYFVQATILLMIQHSPPGSLNALSLTSRNEHVGGDTLDTDIEHLLASCSESMLESAEQLLSSVQYLTLSYAYFPWDSAAYHGLVELRLDLSEDVGSFDWPPSQDEIATILSSSPMLRNLSLKVDYLWDIHDSSIEPICLKHLERFTLELSNRHRCLGLLPLVSPGPNPLSVRVSFHSSPAFWEEVWALAQRSEITSLHVVAEASNSWAVPLSRHLAQLESLTLVGFKINQKALGDFLSMSNNIKTSAWPRLHTLRLMNCRIDEESLMGLLASLQIRKVRMYRMCSTHPVPGSRIGRASPDIATMVELEQRISLVIPDTKYYPFGDLD